MNTKLLYAATFAALSLSTGLAMADGAPLTRAQVVAQTQQAVANGSISRGEFEQDATYVAPAQSNVTRAQVAAELTRNSPNGNVVVGLNGDRAPDATSQQIAPTSVLARSDVKAETRAALANGTLPITEYTSGADLSRQANQHVAAVQRLKARAARNQG